MNALVMFWDDKFSESAPRVFMHCLYFSSCFLLVSTSVSLLFYEGCGSFSLPAGKLKQVVPFPPETHVMSTVNLAMHVFFGPGFIDDVSEAKFPNL